MKAILAVFLLAATMAMPAAGVRAQASLTVDQARALVAPFYDSLNRPAEKDVAKLFDQSTQPQWESCGANDQCLPRDKVIGRFKEFGAGVPNLKWEIKEVIVSGNRIIVRGEGSGTPAGSFLGVPAAGKSFRVMSIDVHTVESGKLVRTYHVEDWASAIRQLAAKN